MAEQEKHHSEDSGEYQLWNDLLLKPEENYILKVIRCNFYETGAEALGKVVAKMKTTVNEY